MSGSALYGQPPNTEEDLWIVKGLLMTAGLDTDPKLGVPVDPQRPANYHFQTRGPQLVVSMSCMISLVILITGIRLALRKFVAPLRFGLDDWMIIPAALTTILWLAFIVAIKCVGGGGKHQYDCTYHEIYWFHRFTAICTLDFFYATTLTKISIVLFNRRLTGLTSKRWMKVHWTFIFLLVTFLISCTIAAITMTSPVQAQYSLIYLGKMTEPPRQRTNEIKVVIGMSVVSTIFDYALLSVPIIILWKIKMSPWKKIGLFFIFSVGGLSCVSAVMRIIIQTHFWNDAPYNFTNMILWAVLEMFFGIIVASLPTFNSLFIIICGQRRKAIDSAVTTISELPNGHSLSEKSRNSLVEDGIFRKDEVELEFRSRLDSDDRRWGDNRTPWTILKGDQSKSSHRVKVSSSYPAP